MKEGTQIVCSIIVIAVCFTASHLASVNYTTKLKNKKCLTRMLEKNYTPKEIVTISQNYEPVYLYCEGLK